MCFMRKCVGFTHELLHAGGSNLCTPVYSSFTDMPSCTVISFYVVDPGAAA